MTTPAPDTAPANLSPPIATLDKATEKRENRLIWLLSAVQFTHILDFMVLNPLGPMLNRDVGLSTDQFGVLVSSYAIAAAIAAIVSTVFVDRYNRKTVLLWLYGGFTIATALCAAAPNYGGLLAARVFAGAFGGILGAMVMTYVGDVIGESRRGRATGRIAGAFALSTVLGVPLSLWLANNLPMLGWRAPFAVVALLGAAVWWAAWRYLPSVQPAVQTDSYWQRMRETLSDRQHQIGFIATAGLLFSSFSVIPYLTIYLTGTVKFPESLLPMMYFFGGVATLFTSRWIGGLADKHGRYKMYALFALLALIPIVLTTHMKAAHPAIVIAVSTLFFVLVSGRWIPLQALLTTVALPHLRGTYTTISSSLQQLAMGLAAFLTGQLIVQHPDGSVSNYEYAGYIAVVCTALSVWVARKLKPRA